MRSGDYIDVVGARSVLEVADVVAAVLGARMEIGGEPGHIAVTGTSDSGLQIVIGLAADDHPAPGPWTQRIAITHQHSNDARARWAHHLHHTLTTRRGWVLTLTSSNPGPADTTVTDDPAD